MIKLLFIIGMNDIIKEILPLLGISEIIVFRQVCRQIDKLLDFNYWIEKFRREEMLIFATKLPANVQAWIREYLITHRVYFEVAKLMKLKYFNYNLPAYDENNNLRLDAIPISELKPPILPGRYGVNLINLIESYHLEENNKNPFTFGILGNEVLHDAKVSESDFMKWESPIELDKNLFLLRLIYYFPDITLTAGTKRNIRLS